VRSIISRPVRFLTAAALAVAMSTASFASSAAPDPEAAALFDEGRKLMNKGDYAGAVPKFQQILQKTKAVGALLNLAECYAKLGKTASAWSTFKQAGTVARESNDAERAKVADDHANALEPQLSKLTITIERDAPGLEVHRDGENVPKSEWGTGVPVDPGSHRIEAVLPGHVPWMQTVDVGGTGTVVLVPAFVSDKPSETKPVAAERASTLEEPSSGSSRKTIGIIVGGVGVAGLAFGGIAGLVAMSKHDDAKSKCVAYPNHCSSDGSAEGPNDDARSFATMSTIGFIGGGALVAIGAALYLTAPKAKAAAVRILPAVSPASASFTIGARF
jgi:hypothetical protein